MESSPNRGRLHGFSVGLWWLMKKFARQNFKKFLLYKNLRGLYYEPFAKTLVLINQCTG